MNKKIIFFTKSAIVRYKINCLSNIEITLEKREL